jgi:hypothetical protein
VRCIESWLLALDGRKGSERVSSSRAKAILAADGVSNLEEKVARVDAAYVDRIPADARSLSEWLALARAALGNP